MTDHTLPQLETRKSVVTSAKVRRALFLIHLWVGLICGIPFVLLGLTGSALMLGHDIPFVASEPHTDASKVGAAIEAAAATVPEGARPTAIDLPAHHGDPATVRFALPRAGQPPALSQGPAGNTRVLVDLATLSTSPDATQVPGGFMRLMHDMHGRLLVEGPNGRALVGWLGVAMTFLGLSGIVLWWPSPGQWKNAFTFRWRRSGLLFSRELHGAVGIWGLIVFIIVSFSGVYIAFPLTLNDAFGASTAVRESRGNQLSVKVTPISEGAPLDVDGVVALARESIVDGIVRSVTLPVAPDQPYRVAMARPGDGSNAPRAIVFVDQWAKRVAEVRDPTTYSANNAFLMWQRPLHTGLGLGSIWWSLVFLSGFLPLLFVITGVAMWILKWRNKKRVMG